MLERCAALVKADPQIPVVAALCDNQFISEGYTMPAIPSRKLGTGIWNGTNILLEILEGHLFAPMCTVIMQTTALRAREGFPIDWPHLADKATWVPMLFTGRAGFVNESCGTYCSHNVTETSKLNIDILLKDVQRFVDLITGMADRFITDSQNCREIKCRAQRYLAQCAIDLIASRRRSGAKLTQVLPTLFRYRRDLTRIGLGNALKLSRPIATILLPTMMTHWLRILFHMAK